MFLVNGWEPQRTMLNVMSSNLLAKHRTDVSHKFGRGTSSMTLYFPGGPLNQIFRHDNSLALTSSIVSIYAHVLYVHVLVI